MGQKKWPIFHFASGSNCPIVQNPIVWYHLLKRLFSTYCLDIVLLKNFCWSVADLPCCISFWRVAKWLFICIDTHTYMYVCTYICMGFPGGSAGKEATCNAGSQGSIPGLGRSPGEGKGYPLQYSGLENSKDCIVHGVTKSWTRLSTFHIHIHHIYIHTHTHTYILFHILFHYGLLQDIEYSSLCYTVGSCGLTILYTVVF